MATIVLRPALPTDSRLIWSWRNAPDVRAVAFDSDPIPWPRHEEWFARKLADPDCLLLIAEDEDGPAGQVRFDLRKGASEAEISVSLTATRRGRGLGSALIESGVRAAASRYPTLHRVHAYIRPGNEASVRAFIRAGFSSVGTAEAKGRPALHFRWERTRKAGGE